MIKLAETPGDVQGYLEAAREHFSHTWGSLRREAILPWRGNNPMYADGKFPVGSSPYHLQAAEQYVQACIEGMHEFLGTTDGQLCPNEECAHDLAFSSSVWWRCPNCEQAFWAEETDSDYEDFHVYKPEERWVLDMSQIVHISWARDLGASWATPRGTS